MIGCQECPAPVKGRGIPDAQKSPWPLNRLDHGTEPIGHAPALMPGLILLHEMVRKGKLTET